MSLVEEDFLEPRLRMMLVDSDQYVAVVVMIASVVLGSLTWIVAETVRPTLQ